MPCIAQRCWRARRRLFFGNAHDRMNRWTIFRESIGFEREIRALEDTDRVLIEIHWTENMAAGREDASRAWTFVGEILLIGWECRTRSNRFYWREERLHSERKIKANDEPAMIPLWGSIIRSINDVRRNEPTRAEETFSVFFGSVLTFFSTQIWKAQPMAWLNRSP